MWVGISKRLGGGFRVGVGTRIGRRARRGPTQREIAKLEKAQFMQKVAEDANALLDQFMVNHSIDPQTARKKNFDLQKFFTDQDVKSDYEIFVSTIKDIKDILAKVEYGGNLTANRKDKLVDRIMTMREIVSRSGPGLNSLAEEISDRYAALGRNIVLCIFGFLLLLMGVGAFLDANTVAWSAHELLSIIIASGIAAFTIYIPVYFILKAFAWASYRKAAVSKMREVHGVP